MTSLCFNEPVRNCGVMYGNFEAYGRFNMNNCVSDRQFKMDFFVLFSGLDEINQYSVINLSSEAYLLSVIGSI